MSYILDALQRADAERTRGGVPTLHARQASSLIPTTRPGARRRVWLAVATTLALGAIATGLWLWHAESATTTNPVVPLASTPSPAPSPAMRPATALPAPTPVPMQQAQQPPTVLPPVTAASPTVPTGTTTPPPPSKASTKTAVAPPPVESTPPQPKPPAVANTVVKDKPTATAVPAPPSLAPLLSELPEPLRREIPALKVSGAVYSDNPAQRLLLVNGLVLNQGSMVTPELTLVEIHSSSSEFSFRGTRFRVTH